MAFFWWKRPGEVPELGEADQKQLEQLRKKVPIPAIWLFGKTGSGKSSVVRYLTGAERASIGQGYRPETQTTQRFDFPDAEDPLVTFHDTRGLGEASYDPRADLEQLSSATQLIVVTVRITDHALAGLLGPLRRIHQFAPERPILLVLTCLHEAMGSTDISKGGDPFHEESSSPAQSTANLAQTPSAIDAPGIEGATSSGTASQRPGVPAGLQLLIDEKRRQFDGLVDAIIPIDLTQPEDGFHNPDFGGPRLKQAILAYLPHAYRQALLSVNTSGTPDESQRQRRARWQVLASSAMAGSVGAVPIPWVDIPAVLAIQAHMAVKIAGIYDQELTSRHWAVLSSAAGSRIAARLALREALKLIPLVGIAAGAASSFAFTYALGMSWDWYFADVRRGRVPDAVQLREIFAEQLKRGHELWRAQ